MFIAKHKDEEEAQELEQRRRAAVAAQPSIVDSKMRQIECLRFCLFTVGFHGTRLFQPWIVFHVTVHTP